MPRLGIDTGGTFTDTVVVDSGTLHTVKTPTTDDLTTGIVEGVETVCEASGIGPEQIDSVIHGSTVAVNALIEGNGARTALLTTEGFEDVLEIGEGYRTSELLYRPCGDRADPLISRRHRYGVAERITANGTVDTELSPDDDVPGDLDDAAIESVAICLLHSFREARHEEMLAEAVANRYPDVAVSVSSRISPEIREYPRTATTAVNAYLKPVVSSYLSRLENQLNAIGVTAPISVIKSDGGLARPAVVAERPITQIISGPVAGVTAARMTGPQIETQDLITLDMGGTSCDTAVVVDGTPAEVSRRSIRGLTVNGPFVDIQTIGAGGGTIASVTEESALRLGPESAGADPGPACYGRGGTSPTVTDADLVLGYLNPDTVAGGSIDLDTDAARAAIREHVADPLDQSVEEAALAIRNVIDTKMASASRVVSVEKGNDPREFSLVAFGGAGPLHGGDVARELSTDGLIFPATPGLFSAVGLMVSAVGHGYVRSVVQPAEEVDVTSLQETVASMLDDAWTELHREGIDPTDRSIDIAFDMQYEAQAHQLTLPFKRETNPSEMVGDNPITDDDIDDILDSFERKHDQTYGFTDDAESIEIVNIRVSARGETHETRIDVEAPSNGASVDSAKRGERFVHLGDDRMKVPYFDWSALPCDAVLPGPAIMESRTSTGWIPPDYSARIDSDGNIRAQRET